MIQEKKKALGRGLESLIPAARGAPPAPGPAKESGEAVHELPVDAIEPSPYQPRRHVSEHAMAELAASIQSQGVLQPIVVRYIGERPHPSKTGWGGPPPTLGGAPAATAPGDGDAHAGARVPQGQVKYQLIAGERRWQASKLAGRTTIPAIVRQVSNEQAMLLALIENIQREDLDAMELAHAFERLSRQFGLTQEQMAVRTGKDRASIANYLRLLKLPQEVQWALGQGQITFGHAKELMSLEDPDLQTATVQKIVKDNMSVRQTELLVNHLVYLGPVSEKEWKKRQRELKEQQKPPEDPNVRAARIELEGRLGCRVKILDHQGKGKVVIEYKSLEDFDRILEALK